jgi:alpha-ketoglutaric semialdehyde dehydrogenase
MYQYGNLIAGQWQPGDGAAFTTVNPARPAEQIGKYTAASVAQVDAAVRAATRAQAEWRKLPSVERAQLLEKFVAVLQQRTEDIARSITLEQGKPLTESRGEIAKACGEARFMAGEGARAQGAVMPSARRGFSNMVTRRPRGVIAALTPWNFPIMTPMRKIAPALVFGNAVILKPSEFTPAAACIIAETAHEVLPPGVLQLVNGMADVGQTLVSHPAVQGVTFTGSVPVGKKVYALAAGNLTEVSLELGGKNAAIVHDPADLEHCLDQIIATAYQCAGQRCTGISRVLVRSDLLTAVCEGLVERIRRMQLGDGTTEGVTMGPLTNAAQLRKVDSMVRAGVAEGARILVGGEPDEMTGCAGGYFYQPTILAGVTPQMTVAREEIFGPVVCMLSYDTVDEALEILNGVEFGLTSALFSTDPSVIRHFVEESQTGMLHVNHGTIPENHMPFGGIKNSGVGACSVGPSAVNFYTTEHAIYLKAN